MRLYELGERKLIELMMKLVRINPKSLLKLGLDDADALNLEGGIYVFNTDFVAESTDKLPEMTYWQLARKCIVANVADLAAKGAEPVGFLASVALPSSLELNSFEKIFKGLDDGAAEYGSYLIGGDLGEAKEVVISVSAFGKVKKALISREGAKEGDVVAVTGFFGWNTLAFKALLEGMELPDIIKKKALEAVLMPKAPLREGLILSELESVTSAIDSSDGLFASLNHLSKTSKVGFLIQKLPIEEELLRFVQKRGLDLIQIVFYGGEEFHLVFTVPSSDWPKVESALRSEGLKAIQIGKVIPGSEVIVVRNQRRIKLHAGGWEHFKG
ncbi:MAG TPA: thiamine-phosphate kinase [Candidatus Korarchaeota archaeon]|nr:thiamine-phosphate kinase [Candidatus Korarchaeota archaeon]